MNDFMTHFHFIRPLVLLALPVVLFILWHLQRNDSSDDGWSKICDAHLLDAIKINKGEKGSRWSLLLWPICVVAIIAIAGPAYKKLPTPTIKNQSGLVIALDISKSMLADDIKPNRLERAKFKINDILDKRKDGQTALIVYSGDAFVVTPLTDDTETIALMLKALSPDIMPVQGSRVDIALVKAQDLLEQAGYRRGDVLLISDGVSSRGNNVAKELYSKNTRVSVLAVGTKDGAPIPLKTGFLKDRSGNIVIPKLDVAALKSLSSQGGGRFVQISGDSSDIEFVLPTQVDDGDDETQFDDDAFGTEKYRDEGPWLTLLLIPLFALLFRKGMLLALFLVVGLQSPQPSYAIDYDDLWLNSDQKAAKLLKDGKHEEAFESARSDQWKATAAFRKKDYQQAKDLFNDGTADGYYNQGNTLAMNGQLEDALKSYDSSLAIRPDDEDTLFNKKQVEDALKQQEQQEQENKDKQDQDKEDQEKKDQDQEKQDSEKSEEDQEQKDGESKDQEGESKDQDDNPEQQEKKSEEGEMTDEEKKKQEEEQKKLEEADQQEKEQQEQEVQLTPEEMAENAENKEAIEQWLRRIPDDPGGLLRRKFYYQYNQQNKKPDEKEDW
jgi:Ca-activated chloride channel family protein